MSRLSSDGCPCSACASERVVFSPSEVIEDTDAAAAACANAEIITHDTEGTKPGTGWGRLKRWRKIADPRASIEDHRIKLRSMYVDLDDDDFEALVETSQARFKKRFCEILAKHYAWVLS